MQRQRSKVTGRSVLVTSSPDSPVAQVLIATVREARTTFHPGGSNAKMFFKRNFSIFHLVTLPIARRCMVRGI